MTMRTDLRVSSRHLLAALLATWLAIPPALAQPVANRPLQFTGQVTPTMVFTLDDSGSMDSEVMLDTNDGAAWYFVGSPGSRGFIDTSASVPWFNSRGVADANWKKFVYLFPNGTAGPTSPRRSRPGRNYGDSTNDHFAIPPTDAYAWARSHTYNPIYYNPQVTYTPWVKAHIPSGALWNSGAGGADVSFSNANPTATRFHPLYPSGTGVTIDLTARQENSTNNFRFSFFPGAVIPKQVTVAGVTRNVTIATGDGLGTNFRDRGTFWEVTEPARSTDPSRVSATVPYFPATYYLVVPTCSDPAPRCVQSYDGRWLRRYEIREGETFPQIASLGRARTYQEELQNFANWFQYYRKRNLLLSAAMGQTLEKIRDLRAAFFLFSETPNNSSNFRVFDFNSTEDSQNWRALLGRVYDNPASSGTPTRATLNRAGQWFDGSLGGTENRLVQFSCQRNAAFVLTDGFANDESVSGISNYSSAASPAGNRNWVNQAPFAWSYNNANSLANIATHWYSTRLAASRSELQAGKVRPDPVPTLAMSDTGLRALVLAVWTGPNRPPAANLNSRWLAIDANRQNLFTQADANRSTLSTLLSTTSTTLSDTDKSALSTAYTQWRLRDVNPDLHMNTYALTMGSVGTLWRPGRPGDRSTTVFTEATPITWLEPNLTRHPRSIDDLWHATIVGRGLMFNAQDVTSLAESLKAAIEAFQRSAGSDASVTLSLVSQARRGASGDNVLAFQVSYRSGAWWGDVKAYELVDEGFVNVSAQAEPVWSAREKLNPRTPESRLLVTVDQGSATPFTSTDLTNTAVRNRLLTGAPTGATAEQVIAYLRGDRSREQLNFRERTDLLGHIVNAEPRYVQGAMSEFADEGHADYRNALKTRRPVIYQGSNGGFLHAFDASNSATDGGRELWGFMPSFVQDRVGALTSPTYVHQFTVDATPLVADVDFSKTSSATAGDAPDWRTVLVGGLRAGGRGFYALDVTNPNVSDETELAGKVLWEFPTAAQRADTSTAGQALLNAIGLSFGEPRVVRTRAAGWVVLLTSGYQNADHRGHVFVLDARTGALLRQFSTPPGVGSESAPVGLAQVAAFSPNPRVVSLVERAYAGDLLGNIWRINLEAENIADWSMTRMTTLRDAAGNPQPVTSRLELTSFAYPGRVARTTIAVGTGRLLDQSDVTIASIASQVQSFYVIQDHGDTVDNARTVLAERNLRIHSDTTLAAQRYREVVGAGGETNIASPNASQRGWFFDLDVAANRERVTENPVIALGLLVFTTNSPSNSACDAASALYVLNLQDGTMQAASSSGGPKWAGYELPNQTLASRPQIRQTANGKLFAAVQLADGSLVNVQLPQIGQRDTRVLSTRELIRRQ